MIKVNRQVCDLCGACVAVCPQDCIMLSEHQVTIEHPECTECLICVRLCPMAALEVADKTAEVRTEQ